MTGEKMTGEKLRALRERRKEEKRLKGERTGPSPEKQAERRLSANDRDVDKMLTDLGPLSG